MKPLPLSILFAFHLMAGFCIAAESPAPAALPAPKFQGDFFGEMARAFGFVVSTDSKAQTMTVKLDRDAKIVTVPIKYDTELHVRDSWGELSDYFPGQRVMLFMYVDDAKNWAYPRAVQDEIHVSARHGWWAKVTAIDKDAHTFATHREEKDAQGKVTRQIDNTISFDPDAKVWKGDTAGGIDTLQLGDEVIQQQIEKDGKKVAAEIFDRKGDAAISAVQDAKHKEDQDKLGLPAYVTDFNPLTGALSVTVVWSGQTRAKQLKPGDAIALQPADGSALFAAAVCSLQPVDSRIRLELVTNSRVVVRLSYGQTLRVFMPGTGPELPTGRAGIPDLSKK